MKPKVKQKSKEAFYKLAVVEGSIHGKPPEEIHFHEVGAVDSIVDIIGSCILMNMLKPCHVYASTVNVGSGTVKCAHGILPVPAPATMELLKGVPVYAGEEPGEYTTPTGALLLSTFVEQYGPMPKGIPGKTGYGLGKAQRKSPNVLRAVLLKEHEGTYLDGLDCDSVVILEANIDDMNPEIMMMLWKAFSKRCLRCISHTDNNEERQTCYKISCLCLSDKNIFWQKTMLCETTTIGVRELEAGRVSSIVKLGR